MQQRACFKGAAAGAEAGPLVASVLQLQQSRAAVRVTRQQQACFNGCSSRCTGCLCPPAAAIKGSSASQLQLVMRAMNPMLA